MPTYPDDFAALVPKRAAREDEFATPEKCVTLANEERWINVGEATRLNAELATLRRKAAAWDALYGLVDATRGMSRAQPVTTTLMADLMRRRRPEADRA